MSAREKKTAGEARRSARAPAKPGPSQGAKESPRAPELVGLVREVLLGQTGAWPLLVGTITPQIVAIVRSHPSMREKKLAGLEDDVSEVTTSSLERLARDDFKNLQRFIARHATADRESAPSFASWLYGNVDFAIRDHLRKRFGRAPRADDTGQRRPSRRDLGTLAGRLDEEPLDRAFVSTLGATKRITVAAIFEYAAKHFEPADAEALRLFYLEDKSSAEIAQLLGLPDERAADKLIRKLNARLRYHFAADDDTSK
jgi:DNA-directed RNA polymerase specialized sigma24 family protein